MRPGSPVPGCRAFRDPGKVPKSSCDLGSLESLPKLTNLAIDGKRTGNLSGLEKLTNLTSLDLSHCMLKDISALSGLTKLWYLNIYDNQITAYCPLRALRT